MKIAGRRSMRLILLGLWAIGFAGPAFQTGSAQALKTRAGESSSLKMKNMGGKATISTDALGGVETLKVDELGKIPIQKDKRPVTDTRAVSAGAAPLCDLHPPKVRDIAAGLARELYAQKIQQTYFVEAFQEGFKSVLAAPHAVVKLAAGQSNDPTASGFALGRNMAVSNAVNLGITLRDYGYAYTNAVGHVFLGVDQSEFRPLGSAQVWWLARDPGLSRAYAAQAQQGRVPSASRTAILGSVLGFLSPTRTGGYGDSGGYSRELVIDKIIELKLNEALP